MVDDRGWEDYYMPSIQSATGSAAKDVEEQSLDTRRQWTTASQRKEQFDLLTQSISKCSWLSLWAVGLEVRMT